MRHWALGAGVQLISDAAEGALVESLASVMQFLEDVDDEDLDPRIAIRWMEWVSYLLNQLPKPDRLAVAALCRERMDQASDPWMRQALETLCTGCGLDEDYEDED
jgi:hypothetical protein